MLFWGPFQGFAQIFRDFVKVFIDFAKIFTDFKRFCPDFHQIKTFGGAIPPLHPTSYTSGAA